MSNLSAALGPVLVALGYTAYGFGVNYLRGDSFNKVKFARVLAASFFLAIVAPEVFPDPTTSNILGLPAVALSAFTALGLLYALNKGMDFASNLIYAVREFLHPDNDSDLLAKVKSKVRKPKHRSEVPSDTPP